MRETTIQGFQYIVIPLFSTHELSAPLPFGTGQISAKQLSAVVNKDENVYLSILKVNFHYDSSTLLFMCVLRGD